MDIGSLQETIQSLKDVDAWDTLDRVDVQECEVLDYDSASAVVGEGEATTLCVTTTGRKTSSLFASAECGPNLITSLGE